MKWQRYLAVLSAVVITLSAAACEELDQVTSPPPPAEETPAQAPAGPYIDSLDPSSGAPGIEETIHGKNFIKQWVYQTTVSFGGREAEVIPPITDSRIVVKVPPKFPRGEGTATVEVVVEIPLLARSNSKPFTYAEPVTVGIEPPSGLPGDEVRIIGRNFGLERPFGLGTYVKFEDSLLSPDEIISWADTEIVVKAPSDYGMGIKHVKDVATLARHNSEKIIYTSRSGYWDC
ncbi:IPT/TIG domain-containing protein [Dehalococcoidia bacterium]|nr:IPT/TIG domain-containing protein [Dehalococcoidia bacterium]